MDAMDAILAQLKRLQDEVENLQTKEGVCLRLIEGVTVGAGGAANFDFQNIPATFAKLVIDLYGRGDTVATGVLVNLRFNNDGTALYYGNTTRINGSGTTFIDSTIGGTSLALGQIAAASSTALAFDSLILNIPNYANSNAHKILNGNGGLTTGDLTANQQTSIIMGRYKSTNAISRITLTPSAGNFAQYSTARLYGVL